MENKTQNTIEKGCVSAVGSGRFVRDSEKDEQQAGCVDDNKSDRYKFLPQQLQFAASHRSELEWLHLFEACPVRFALLADRLGSWQVAEHTLNLWKSLGRPHPASMRQDILWGKLTPTDEILILLSYAWDISIREKFTAHNVKDQRRPAEDSK